MSLLEVQNRLVEEEGARQVVLSVEPGLYGATIRNENGKHEQRLSRLAATLGSLAAGVVLVCLLSEVSSPQSNPEVSLLADRSQMSLASAIKQFSRSQRTTQNSNTAGSSSQSDSQAPLQHGISSPEEAYDVTIPAGISAGQSFLVDVPGRRERDVTAPSGTKAGEIVSIDLPDDPQQAATSTTLQSAAAPEQPPSPSSAPGQGGPVAPQISTEAESAGAEAVSSVHSFFHSQKQDFHSEWIPGDTQKIPALPRLRFAPTFAPNGHAGALPGTSSGDWTPGQPHAYRHDPQQAVSLPRWNHFRAVTKAKEQYEMSKPVYSPSALASGGAAATGMEAPAAGEAAEAPLHTAAYTHPGVSAGGQAGEHDAGRAAQQAAGFIVATPDDAAPHSRDQDAASHAAPGSASASSASTGEPAAARQIVIKVQPAEPAAGALVGGPGTMEEVPLGGEGGVIFPMPSSSLPPEEMRMHPVVQAGSSAPGPVTVTVRQGPPGPVPRTVTVSGSSDGHVARITAHVESHPELQKIPALPHLKYFHHGRETPGTFRHWDGKTYKVLNVVPESPEGAIVLDPETWAPPQPPAPAASAAGSPAGAGGGGQGAGGVEGLPPPQAQAQAGMRFAEQAEGHFAGTDRSAVGYRTYGDVAPAVAAQVGASQQEPAA